VPCVLLKAGVPTFRDNSPATCNEFRNEITFIHLYCALFSLEPLAQDLTDNEITDKCYVNLFTPLPLPCSALTEAWKPFGVDHSVWIVWGVYITKVRFGAGGKILSRNVLRRGQRVRAGVTCYICVLLVHLCAIKGQKYIFCCTTKPAQSRWIYLVSKNFHNCVIC
jgi:hypothetical protein